MDQVTQVKTQIRLEHWKQLISECQASGMSVCSWCKENNVSEPSYYYYLKRLRQQAASGIQEISVLVINAVSKLVDNANEMLRFMETNVIKDYDSFVEIMNQYQIDTNELNQLIAQFASEATNMSDTMQHMSSGMSDMALTIDESANAIALVATDASELVETMVDIQNETNNNSRVSEELMEEVKRFKKL